MRRRVCEGVPSFDHESTKRELRPGLISQRESGGTVVFGVNLGIELPSRGTL